MVRHSIEMAADLLFREYIMAQLPPSTPQHSQNPLRLLTMFGYKAFFPLAGAALQSVVVASPVNSTGVASRAASAVSALQ